MRMVYIHSHVNDPKGSEKISSLHDFFLSLPGVGLTIKKTKIIPPLNVVNELLSQGKCDAGMSGCFEWRPFKIDTKDFEVFKVALEKALGKDAKTLKEEDVSLKKWMSLARSQFRL